MVDKENKYGNAWDKIEFEWGMAGDKSKEIWDGVVEKVIDTYKGAEDWTDDMVTEAKEHFKSHYDEMMLGDKDR